MSIAINKLMQVAGNKKALKRLEKGFTLVELMVVIVIVGVLSSVALPQFMGVKDKAKLNTQIAELAGLARECSSAIIAEGPYPSAYASGTDENTNTGLAISGNCNGGDISTAPGANISYTTTVAKSSGAKCGSIIISSGKKCMATIESSNGLISYSEI